eukprot:2047856-Amphidinium_carterae.1
MLRNNCPSHCQDCTGCAACCAEAVAFPSEVGLGLVWVWLGKSEPKGLPEDIVNFENTHLGPQVPTPLFSIIL